jgi:transcriptional regulator with XRE-family HTH domain
VYYEKAPSDAAALLKKFRRERNISQRQLADEAGVHPS